MIDAGVNSDVSQLSTCDLIAEAILKQSVTMAMDTLLVLTLWLCLQKFIRI